MHGLSEYNRQYLDLDGRTIQPDLKVGFVLLPGFTMLSFASFMDTLRHAADESDHSRQVYCKWTVLGPTRDPIHASSGVAIEPWEVYGDPGEFDYIVVVGGQTGEVGPHLQPSLEFLRQADELQVPLIGLCVGVFALAEAGLMRGRRCAVHSRHYEELLQRYPEVVPVVDELFVVDRDRLTCPGGTASIDLAVTILMRHCSKARAMKGLSHMMVDNYREGGHTPRHPYEDLVHCKDSLIVQAVRLMRQNTTFPFSVKELAHQLGCSLRQLERSFQKHVQTSPNKFWRQLRLQRARWYLLNTTQTVTQIAYDCGFSDCAHFTKTFSQFYGESPNRFREVRLRASQSTR
jgi:transcriptional regulator GlxA family with amidase domain